MIYMKNIDRMKESLIRQIQAMDIDDYERLNSALCQKIPYPYGNDTGWCVVDRSAVLTCEECSRIFGRCTFDARESCDLCEVRFELYAEMESDISSKM